MASFIALLILLASLSPRVLAASLSSQSQLNLVSRGSWEYIDCGTAQDALQLQSLTISPDPPVIGQTLTLHVSADFQEDIDEGADVDVSVKLGLVKLLQKQVDFCEEARDNNWAVQCPITTGSYTWNVTIDIPKTTPRAKYMTQLRGYTAGGSDLLCLDIFTSFLRF